MAAAGAHMERRCAAFHCGVNTAAMNDLATYAYPFMLSIVALAAGWLLIGRHIRTVSGAAPKLLFGLGIAAAMVGFFLVWQSAR